MASKIEDHGAIPSRRLADLLHSTQEGDSSHCFRITEEKGTDLNLMAHNLAQLESFCGFIPIKANSKAPKVTYKGKPYLTLKECLSYKPAAIAVRSEKIAGLDYDYSRGLDYVASRGIDFTAKGLHIRKTSDNWKGDDTGLDFGKFKTLFVLTDEQAEEIGSCNSAKQNYQDSGIDVFPKAKPYIIVLGAHETEGFYYSPNGLGVVDLAPPSPEVFELLVEANKSKPTTKTTRSSSSCNRDWIPARPCPICTRDIDDDCRVNKAGDVVLCHRGNTFHPPTLAVGEILTGTKWAYCGEGESAIGTHSTFKIHRPTTRSKRPSRRYRRVTNAK